jgi:PTS system glucitol/sorbitol-specific IIA component
MNYSTTITRLGDMVRELIDSNILIVFDENAPEELAELSVLHTAADLRRDVRPGDGVLLGNKEYRVAVVGYDANRTLREMGHCTFMFGGSFGADLPGQIQLEGDGLPNVRPGDPFEVRFR